MTQSTGGFELRSDEGDETRLLVHPVRAYAIAIPGRPRVVVSATGSPRYNIVLELGDAPVELGFRMDEVPTTIAPEDLVSSLSLAYAMSRAADPASVTPGMLPGPLLAGAAAGSVANYRLSSANSQAMEFLAITANGSPPNVHALHMTVRYLRAEVTPFDWANLRAALLSHQSWTPGVLPSMRIWPESTFALPSVTLQLSEAARTEARAKANEVGNVSPDEVDQLADLLLESVNTNDAPTIPMHPFVHQITSRKVAACVSPRIAEILLRNIAEVMSMHDFRAWCWQCYWAVGNRAELRAIS